jgi:hypothetical protein
MIPVLALLLLPVAGPAAIQHDPDDPPIRVTLSDETYARGDRARVRVKANRDGYLLVLRADADGRVRVLFPRDPEDTAVVQGGKNFEVRGRGDREAFTVHDREGTGVVLAAFADAPFRFDEFARSGHWDYRVLSAERAGDDPEAGLLDLVDRMSQGKYDYDIATYTVMSRDYPRSYSGWHDPWYDGHYWPGWYGGSRVGFRISVGFGHGHPWGGWWY